MQHKFILTADASRHDHIKGAWQSSISIYVGDWYSSAGTVYECILAHTSAGGNAPPNVTYWTPAVLAGTSLGSVVWRGAWSGITTYAAGDGVIEGGLAYVSIQGTNLNHQPPNTSWWAAITYSVGDVVGPGSAVSANMVEFDGATGKLIKDGALTHANVADAITKKHAIDTDPSEISGWAPAPALTYSAADAPVYTVTCSGDYSAVIMAGMRIKLTHDGSTKYFIVVKSTYGAPNTTLTLYGGTDYTLAAGAITNPFYSMAKAPAGFPLDSSKWTVTVTDTSDRTQATPSATVWYNLGSILISVPIGLWIAKYKVLAEIAVSSGWIDMFVTLSTANNSESDARFTDKVYVNAIAGWGWNATMFADLIVSSKTTYYLNAKTSSSNAYSIDFKNSQSACKITLICGYL